MKKLSLIIGLMLISLSMFAAKVDKQMNISVNGESRQYWLYVPNNVKTNTSLVFCCHGTGGNCSGKSPNFCSIADKEGIIVVYPQGKTIPFPIFGGSLPGWHSTGEDSEDIPFFKAMIEELCSKYKIDRNRIYMCGFSNGGMMTYSMANTCADIFAAYASISGYQINEFHMHHTGCRPVPFLHIHGKNDDFVRYALYPNIRDNMVARLGANPVPTVTTVNGKYRKSVYAATEGSFPFVYYEIDGMGHNDYTGNTEDGNSNQTMWNFMKQYTLDSPCDTTLQWRPNIEQEGWDPKEHGWSISNTMLMFGGDQNTDANQNVYRSLQLAKGLHQFRFHIDDTEATKVTVRIQKIGGNKKLVLSKTDTFLGDVKLNFEVKDTWAEYQLTIRKMSTATLSKIAIHSVTQEEIDADGICEIEYDEDNSSDKVYNIAGQQVNSVSRGINIVNGKKYFIK